MSILTIREARAFIETDLIDFALQMLIDDAEAEITEQVGKIDSQVDIFSEEQMPMAFYTGDERPYLFLTRKAVSITSIIEKVRWGGGYWGNGYTIYTLASDDYFLRENNRTIERMAHGTNPRNMWGNVVTVTYVPQDDTARRKQVAIDLVKLAVTYNGVDTERIGDYSSVSKNHNEERNRLISRLRSWSIT
jgi:hypothetical protein